MSTQYLCNSGWGKESSTVFARGLLTLIEHAARAGKRELSLVGRDDGRNTWRV